MAVPDGNHRVSTARSDDLANLRRAADDDGGRYAGISRLHAKSAVADRAEFRGRIVEANFEAAVSSPRTLPGGAAAVVVGR
jgi:hypothetical protein